MPQHVDGDTAEQIEVGLAVHIGDHGAIAAGQSQRRDTVVVHHHRGPPLLDGVGLCSSGAHALTTFVPEPWSVSSSTNTQCSTRPSMTCALGTPAVTARRQASTFGIMSVYSVGSSCAKAAVLISLANESRSGHLV